MHVLIAHNDYARPSGEEHAIDMIGELLTGRSHRVSWMRPSSATIGAGTASQLEAGLSGVWSAAARRRMAAQLDRDRPDLVLAQNLYPLLSPSILAPCTARGIPVVMRCPNYRLTCPSGLHMTGGAICERCLGAGREAWCLLRNCEHSLPKSAAYALRGAVARLSGVIRRHVSLYIVLTDFQKARFEAAGISSDRLAVVPNTAPAYCWDLDAGGGGHVGFMGRVALEKGAVPLLEIAHRCPDIPFVVAGAVKETARSVVANAPPNITFRGHLDGAALVEFLRNTRVMLSCSICFEGFPNAVVQAMAAGRPVVASALGGVPAIVGDGVAGRLYAPADPGAAAAHVRALYNDPVAAAAMGAAGRIRAERLYRPDRVADRMLEALARAEASRHAV